ncbi:alpha/beta hydrolase [Fundidesulfovibrio terrae]|uniref:alpha/beta hydrolase n=1 Tax=Fundidesulfovibrio terrae TaxID=2922866 RepID=UPI001FAED9C8|nr:alpha/beta hydrolase [Fundidesulfovibrio terrae]
MNTTPLSLDDLGLEATTLECIKARIALNQPPIYDIPVDIARKALEIAQAQFKDKPKALSDDLTLPVGPTGTLGIRLLRPSGAPGKLPAAVYLHGGGWVLGSPDTHDRLARDIVATSGVALVMVRYDRAPEARYPVALEQAYAATAWIAENGEALGLDSSRLAVAGDSAGASLAAGVAILAKRRQGPRIRHQTLIYPVTDASCSLQSYLDFEDGPNLTRRAMQWYWDQYAPDADSKAQDTASVLNASRDSLTGLPPALVITAEFDVLRDEGEAYARNMLKAGVPVTATRYLGTIHGFCANNTLAGTPATRAAIAQVGAALKAHLRA